MTFFLRHFLSLKIFKMNSGKGILNMKQFQLGVAYKHIKSVKLLQNSISNIKISHKF